jgi:hypothetical protein
LKVSPCNCTVPITVSFETRSFKSPRLMVYDSGAESTRRGDLFANSRRRLYSSSGSVTLPACGTGGVTLSCANAGTAIRNTTARNNFFISHLPFSRVDSSDRCWELGFLP